MHRPEDVKYIQNQANNSPFRIRTHTPARQANRTPHSSARVPDAHAIYVGDLPLDATEDQIRDVLSTFGNIETVNILRKEVEDGKQ